MNVAASPAVLRTVEGISVPLHGVAVHARLSDLLAEVAVTQTYGNVEAVTIEAVYAFPLPVDAVLLDVEVMLGERRLAGRVVARKAAKRDYEEAIVAGDAALMIERPEPGLYVMNVGNLLPGAEVRITFRYAMVLRCQRGQYRFLHPTTIAPRYGRWALSPHQVPETSLDVDHACTLELEAAGMLARAAFASASHEIEVERRDDRTIIRLRQGRMLMDRDFVLDIRAENAPRAAVLCGADLDGGHACLALLQPDLAAAAEPAARDLKIVVDCSGSMQGDSIAQARIAVQRILELLRPQDRFTFMLFGTTHRVLFPAMAPGDDVTIAAALRAADVGMVASMGGTEIGAALAAAYRIPVRHEAAPTLMLITDGEITDTQAMVRAARASRHRLFTVGVGSAVAEGLLRDLAAATGGACELVAPREDMAERIVRHFRRIDSGGARLSIDWPAPARDLVGHDERIFGGDTAVVFARFDQAPEGRVRFDLTLPDGRRASETAPVAPAPTHVDGRAGAVSTVARLAAARRLFALGVAIDAAADTERARLEAEAASLAERYQLLSPWTNWLLVVAQAHEQAGELPVMRNVPHMLAAGWGGLGRVSAEQLLGSTPAHVHELAMGTPAHVPERAERRVLKMNFGRLRTARPADLVKRPSGAFVETALAPALARLLAEAATRRSRWFRSGITGGRRSDVPTIDELAGLPDIPADVIADLRRLVAQGLDERQVVVAFLVLLAKVAATARLADVVKRRSGVFVFGGVLDRDTHRRILKLRREVAPSDAVMEQVRTAVQTAIVQLVATEFARW